MGVEENAKHLCALLKCATAFFAFLGQSKMPKMAEPLPLIQLPRAPKDKSSLLYFTRSLYLGSTAFSKTLNALMESACKSFDLSAEIMPSVSG